MSKYLRHNGKFVRTQGGDFLLGEAVSGGETWVINSSPTITSNATYNIEVTYNYHFDTGLVAQTFGYSRSKIDPESVVWQLYITCGSDSIFSFSSWQGIEPSIRTVTFSTSPTGDLLTWLQANAVKQ